MKNLSKLFRQPHLNQQLRSKFSTQTLQNDPKLQTILKKLKSLNLQQKCYFPITNLQQKEKEKSIIDSKFCGTQIKIQDEDSQTCEFCKKNLQLFVQLNSNQFPIEIDEKIKQKLFQIHYCVNEECLSFASYEPFAYGSVSRKCINLNEHKLENFIKCQTDLNLNKPQIYKSKSILSWDEQEDFPHIEYIQDLRLPDISDEDLEYYSNFYPLKGDKLLGWPRWIQDVEYPECQQCGHEMDYLLQVESMQNIPFMFGDYGTAFLCYCPNHPEVVSFGWQSH